MISLNSLFESKPEHPNDIVIKNEFYPYGLTQQHVYDYYISNKYNILQNTKNRDLLFFFAINLNKFIVKRKIGNSYHTLTKDNYETIISGRTVSVHNTMNEKENFGVIDIDTDDFNLAKSTTKDICLNLNYKYIIYFSGKTSFHIHVLLNKYSSPMENKKELTNILSNTGFQINGRRDPNKVNIDLSSNKYRGGFICPYSLSILGLKAIPIGINEIDNFQKLDAKC